MTVNNKILILVLASAFLLSACSHVASGMRGMADGVDNMGQDLGRTFKHRTANNDSASLRNSPYYSANDYEVYRNTLAEAGGIYDESVPGIANPPMAPATVPYRIRDNGVPLRSDPDVVIYAPDGSIMGQPSMPAAPGYSVAAPYAQPQPYMQPQMRRPFSGLPPNAQPMLTAPPVAQTPYNDATKIFFNEGSTTLSEADKQTVRSIAAQHRMNPGSRIFVEGYASGSGRQSWNLKLSNKRAENVADCLIKSGVPPMSITRRGMGESPAMSHIPGMSTEQARRRVDIYFGN